MCGCVGPLHWGQVVADHRRLPVERGASGCWSATSSASERPRQVLFSSSAVAGWALTPCSAAHRGRSHRAGGPGRPRGVHRIGRTTPAVLPGTPAGTAVSAPPCPGAGSRGRSGRPRSHTPLGASSSPPRGGGPLDRHTRTAPGTGRRPLRSPDPGTARMRRSRSHVPNQSPGRPRRPTPAADRARSGPLSDAMTSVPNSAGAATSRQLGHRSRSAADLRCPAPRRTAGPAGS